MTTQQNQLLQLFKAAEAARQAIEEATDTLHFEDSQPVTALEGWQIERIYTGLCSVLVELDQAVEAAGALIAPAQPDLFPLGEIVKTFKAAMTLAPWQFEAYLQSHRRGDWGVICAEDKALNESAVQVGERIVSAYPINPSNPCKGHGANCVWIITEADRSVTTFLLPEEY